MWKRSICLPLSNLSYNSVLVCWRGEGRRSPTHWNDRHHSSCSLYGGTAQPAAQHRPLPQPPHLDVPVAQATGLHRLHPQTLLDTAVAQATCTHQSQPVVGDAVAQGGAQSLQCPLWEKLEKAKNYFLGRKKNKFYLQQSCAEYARRGAELIGLPVSGPIFSPCRHSWRISLLAVESASKKHHKKRSSNNHLPAFIYWTTKSVEGDTM